MRKPSMSYSRPWEVDINNQLRPDPKASGVGAMAFLLASRSTSNLDKHIERTGRFGDEYTVPGIVVCPPVPNLYPEMATSENRMLGINADRPSFQFC